MKSNIVSLKNSFSKLKEKKLDSMIKDLPQNQQEAVKICFKACSAQSGHGIRYTTNWVYECVLMKIKSPALYQKIYREKILPVPSTVTLRRYIKKLKPAYGFQTSTFKMLEEKTKHMKSVECHGNFCHEK